jgi:protochlorophyllide reductase
MPVLSVSLAALAASQAEFFQVGGPVVMQPGQLPVSLDTPAQYYAGQDFAYVDQEAYGFAPGPMVVEEEVDAGLSFSEGCIAAAAVFGAVALANASRSSASRSPVAAQALAALADQERKLAMLAVFPGDMLGNRGRNTDPDLEAPVVGQVAGNNPTKELAGKKLYEGNKGIPAIMGGVKVGNRKIVVVTGASSGLGLWCTKALVDKGNHFVICAVRDVEKMNSAAKAIGINKDSFFAMKLELGSFESVKDFVNNFKLFSPQRGIDHLVLNAAVYRPTDPKPAWTDDGFEMSFGVNHLGHFLLLQLLMPDLKKAKEARVCWVGSITGNNNTIGGGMVYPRAEVGELQGIKRGPGADMVNGGKFDGAKAYKDSKALNMMTITELHKRFHEEHGITFTSMYPGCIAETNLFREKRGWFKRVFPLFMKYVTGGYVSEVEAGERLAQTIYDPQCSKSGVYWSWNGNAQMVGLKSRVLNKQTGKWEWQLQGAGGSGGEVFENKFSSMINDPRRAKIQYDACMDLVKDYLPKNQK